MAHVAAMRKGEMNRRDLIRLYEIKYAMADRSLFGRIMWGSNTKNGNWNELIQNRLLWQAFVNMVMNLQIS
jgi:hypothetical protein